MAGTIDIIRAEHKALDRVLAALQAVVAKLSDKGRKPDLDLLYSVIYYIRVFPERYHHPKEETYLFQALRRRCPASARVLDELEEQHQEGGRLIADLDQALKAFDRSYPEGLADLQAATARFVDFQRQHIGQEEREVLPLARERLTEGDWREIDRAFASNTDPLFGENLQAGFRALGDYITRGQ